MIITTNLSGEAGDAQTNEGSRQWLSPLSVGTQLLRGLLALLTVVGGLGVTPAVMGLATAPRRGAAGRDVR